jgi:hypothetical protein
MGKVQGEEKIIDSSAERPASLSMAQGIVVCLWWRATPPNVRPFDENVASFASFQIVCSSKSGLRLEDCFF